MNLSLLNLQIDTPVLIVGYGISGQSVHRLLLAMGVPERDVLIFDESHPKAGIQSPGAQELDLVKTLVLSPGVPMKTPWIQKLLSKGVSLTSELSLSYACFENERVISVTGSIGKSTVTSLIGVAAKAKDPHVFVGGNLGTPLADYAYEVLFGARPRAEWVVLELSSYQLENFIPLNSEISVLTYLTPNHLERYDSLDEYYRTKWSLFQKTTKLAVFNRHGGDLEKDFQNRFAAKIFPPTLSVRWCDSSQWPKDSPVKLLGQYNKDNLAIARAICEFCQWPEESLRALQNFPGLSHRFENLGEHQGRLFINDSKATTMDSVLSGVETVRSEVQLAKRPHWILLLGGHDKNLPWESLQILKNEPKLRILFFGEFGGQAKVRTQLPGEVFPTLKLALESLPTTSGVGDLVLLSPGGTSHDEFKNFEERGIFFRQEVLRIFSKSN
jgi:UDP-N-acetylmuramoylalanine--D-glutamate ligase